MKTKFEKMSKKDRNLLIADFCNLSIHRSIPDYDRDWNVLLDVVHRIEIMTKRKFVIPRSKGVGYNIVLTYRKVFEKVLELSSKVVTPPYQPMLQIIN